MLALYEPSRSLAHLPTACRALTHGRSLRRLVPNGLGVRWCSSEKREQETPDPPEPWLGSWFFQLKHLLRDLDDLMSFYSIFCYLLELNIGIKKRHQNFQNPHFCSPLQCSASEAQKGLLQNGSPSLSLSEKKRTHCFFLVFCVFSF